MKSNLAKHVAIAGVMLTLSSGVASAEPVLSRCGGEVAGIGVEAHCEAPFSLAKQTPVTVALEPGAAYTGYIVASACDARHCIEALGQFVAGQVVPNSQTTVPGTLDAGDWILRVRAWSGSRSAGTPGVPGRCLTYLLCTPSIPPTHWSVPLPAYGPFGASVT